MIGTYDDSNEYPLNFVRPRGYFLLVLFGQTIDLPHLPLPVALLDSVHNRLIDYLLAVRVGFLRVER